MIKHKKPSLNEFEITQLIEQKFQQYPDWIDYVYELVHMIPDKMLKIEYLKRLAHKALPSDLYMISKDLYTWRVFNDLVVICYYSGDYQGSYNAWKELMNRLDYIPYEVRQRCIDNGNYAKMKLNIDTNIDLNV